MSCNGCRVLRKGCGDACFLRSCLCWIDSSEAQGNATLFLAKFFGRSDLLSFISAVPDHQRQALFQSLLFEACGRTVNPVNGALGLIWSGNWHVCEAAVGTVLNGGVIRPISLGAGSNLKKPKLDESTSSFNTDSCMGQNLCYQCRPSARDEKYNQPLDLDISISGIVSAKSGSGRGRRSFPVEKMRRMEAKFSDLYSSDDSAMTSFGSEEMIGEFKERKLLNLFV